MKKIKNKYKIMLNINKYVYIIWVIKGPKNYLKLKSLYIPNLKKAIWIKIK
jgi:hypothetical protein